MFDHVYHVLVGCHVFDVLWFNIVQPRLDLLGLTNGRHATVVEFGCGYGTFTIPVPWLALSLWDSGNQCSLWWVVEKVTANISSNIHTYITFIIIYIYIICKYVNILNSVPLGLSECEWNSKQSLQIVTASLQTASSGQTLVARDARVIRAIKIQVAQRVQQLYSFDIDQEMVSSTRQRCSDLRSFTWAACCAQLCIIFISCGGFRNFHSV